MAEKKYIEQEAALSAVGCGNLHKGIVDALQENINAIPAADVRPVVLCRDCKLHDNCYTEDVFKFARLNDDKRFCGVGERKGGNE